MKLSKTTNMYEFIKAMHEKAGKSTQESVIETTADRLLLLAEYLSTDDVSRVLTGCSDALISDFQGAKSITYRQICSLRDEVAHLKADILMAKASLDSIAEAKASLPADKAEIVELTQRLMETYEKNGASPDVAARCTSYEIWAYLGCSGTPGGDGA